MTGLCTARQTVLEAVPLSARQIGVALEWLTVAPRAFGATSRMSQIELNVALFSCIQIGTTQAENCRLALHSNGRGLKNRKYWEAREPPAQETTVSH